MNAANFSGKRFRLIFFSWWLVWMIIHIVVVNSFSLTLQQVLTDSILSNLFLAGTCWLVASNMRFYLPQKERYWYILFISLSFSAICLLFTRWIISLIAYNQPDFSEFVRRSQGIRYAFDFLMISCSSMISLLFFSQKEKAEILQREMDTDQLRKEAELMQLRQQLQPHFLFNSLNSISALIGSKPKEARHMIHQLSDFLRGTLRKDEHHWNTLAEELEQLSLYLDIEKIRFGHRLDAIITTSEESNTMKLPALILQPIVENAIKFGLYDTIEAVTITIHAEKQNDLLKVLVTNPFDLETAAANKGTGFGLVSISRRLWLLFGRNDLLKTSTKENQFITELMIPQQR
jgi:two-component system LytT family sensor kinase